MIVIRMAITPSENASSRDLPTVLLQSACAQPKLERLPRADEVPEREAHHGQAGRAALGREGPSQEARDEQADDRADEGVDDGRGPRVPLRLGGELLVGDVLFAHWDFSVTWILRKGSGKPLGSAGYGPASCTEPS